MCHAVAVTAPDDAQVVHVFRGVREPIRDFDPGLAVFFERPLRSEQSVLIDAAARLHGSERGGQFFAVQLGQRRLRVKRIDVRRPAGHEQKQHPLGRGFVMRLAGARGSIGTSARALRSSATRAARASEPNPAPALRSMARRSRNVGPSPVMVSLSGVRNGDRHHEDLEPVPVLPSPISRGRRTH